MPANFNTIAYVYDGLSGFVFGNTIKKSQIEMLPFIPDNSDILVVGGGTGWILEEISKIHLAGLQITYVDSSSKMIDLAKRRNLADNKILFITAPFEGLQFQQQFDVVITPFLLDMFQQAMCDKIAKLLHNSLKPRGIWLYSDFQLLPKSKMWQKAMLSLMYYFFKISCKIETRQLPQTDEYFLKYCMLAEKKYMNNFIVSKALTKLPELVENDGTLFTDII